MESFENQHSFFIYPPNPPKSRYKIISSHSKHYPHSKMRKRTTLLSGVFGVLLFPLYFLSPRLLTTGTPPLIEATTADTTLFQEKLQLAAQAGDPVNGALDIARSFLGTPYVTGCLDRNRNEKLVVDLRELDCWTFVENSVAIAMSRNGDFDSYTSLLRHLRYWGGFIDGYGSRIHYFTGWLLQAEKLGVIENMTKSMGGVRYLKKVGYISARPGKYPKIENAKALQNIKKAEKRINVHEWYFIPQHKIAQMEHLIQEGDIICLTSSKHDLDIAHQGFAVKGDDGHIHLLHASSLAKKVIIGRQPLADYVLSQPGQSGIMVARIKKT